MRIIREMFILAIGAAAVLYLINPTLGVFELLPDNLPLIGNLDEAGATVILVNVLGYYGISVDRFTRKRPPAD